MVFALFITEYLHLLFVGSKFNDTVNLDSAVFYFVFSLFGSGLISSVVIFLILDKQKIASKAIMCGVIFWNLIEVIENFQYLAKINRNVLFINDSSIWQIFTTFSIILLSSYGFTKFKS